MIIIENKLTTNTTKITSSRIHNYTSGMESKLTPATCCARVMMFEIVKLSNITKLTLTIPITRHSA